MFSHASTISQLSAKDGTSFAPPGHTLRPPLPCSAQAQALRPSICLPAWPARCGTGAAMRHCATSDMWACNDFVFVPSHPGWCSWHPMILLLWSFVQDENNVALQRVLTPYDCDEWMICLMCVSNGKQCINQSKYGKPKQEQQTHMFEQARTISPQRKLHQKEKLNTQLCILSNFKKIHSKMT